MTEVENRIARCFVNVFPGVTPSDLRSASQASLARWDSLAHVTLLAAVSEAFDIELDEDAFESLTSYELIVDYVESQVSRVGLA